MKNSTYYFETKDLTVGYNKVPLIKNINIQISRGEILTLIGPNGSGKSTILKSITNHLERLAGTVFIDKDSIQKLSQKELATKLSVVLTERIKPEMMTCYDVVATGRYPYTDNFGRLTDHDKEVIMDSIKKVHALDIIDKDFLETSDGQRQRILLARAICQEPEIIVLDEPTSYLDIRHKLELLTILHQMAKEKNIAIIMSLHEIDLAPKISDYVACVKGEFIANYGRPEQIFTDQIIHDLYDLNVGSYNSVFGSVELEKINTKPSVFVIGGAGTASKYYRLLQKKNISFYSGILYENDVDYPVSKALAFDTISIPSYQLITEEIKKNAIKKLEEVETILFTAPPIGSLNTFNLELLEIAKSMNKKIIDISKGDSYE